MKRPLTPGPLLRAANGVLSDLYAAQAPGGLTILQLLVLRALAAHGAQNQTALVANAGTDRSTLSFLLPGLEKADLVERVLDPKDVRAKLVSLTPKGKNAIGAAGTALKVAEGILLRRVPKHHQAAFLSGLASISQGPQQK